MRRVTCSRALRASLCAFVFSLAATLLSLWVWVESAERPHERTARARGCPLCHGSDFTRELLPPLRHHHPGTPIRPALQQHLIQVHPLLSQGARDELTEWLACSQLPALAESRKEAPGEALYRAKCAVCHGSDGLGQPGSYPPLRGSEWLTETPSRLPEILTQGLSGPISVRGKQWNATMLPPGLSNEKEVSDVIHYLISTFIP